MVEDQLIGPSRSRGLEMLLGLRDTLLHSYSQILFARSLTVGGLLLLATMLSPRIGLTGLAAVLLAALIASAVGFAAESIRAGLFGYNALLVGLGAAALLPPGPTFVGLTVVSVLAVVLVSGAFQSALGFVFDLPSLTLPFLLVFYLLLGGAPLLGQDLVFSFDAASVSDEAVPELLRGYLSSLGAIFFLPRIDVGLVVLASLVTYSRIGFLLSLVGYGIAVLATGLIAVSTGLLPLVIGYNFILVSIALGGVWFVPGPASFLLAAAGTLVSGLVSLGLIALLAPSGIPLLILPFNATVLLVLHAMRQRVEDQGPKSVDFVPGSPEQNLRYFRTRLARFGTRYWIHFRVPFLGTWICTQGVDGEISHRGAWRHAFDFEVADEEGGRTFRGDGREVADYHCFGLPVLATADGRVAKVSDGVPNNPVGELNLRQNWGNYVILRHAAGLYSMVAHLSPGTLAVREGDFVRRGDELGRCGSSGRAAVPHLHLQLQRTARAGDASLPGELHEIIQPLEHEDRLEAALVPEEGMRLRGIQRDEDLAARFAFPYREPLVFEVESDRRCRRETLLGDIDVYGNLVLRSLTRRARLFYELEEDMLVVLDTIGPRSSMLHLIHAAIPRIPFELSPRLFWNDSLPRHRFLPWTVRMLLDPVSPFVSDRGTSMRYHAIRDQSVIEIVGRSEPDSFGHGTSVETSARFSSARGLEQVEVLMGSRRRVARRQEVEGDVEIESDRT